MAISGAQDIYNATLAAHDLAQTYKAAHADELDPMYSFAINTESQTNYAAQQAWQMLQRENSVNNPVGQ